MLENVAEWVLAVGAAIIALVRLNEGRRPVALGLGVLAFVLLSLQVGQTFWPKSKGGELAESVIRTGSCVAMIYLLRLERRNQSRGAMAEREEDYTSSH